jgi:hypothetical protein
MSWWWADGLAKSSLTGRTPETVIVVPHPPEGRGEGRCGRTRSLIADAVKAGEEAGPPDQALAVNQPVTSVGVENAGRASADRRAHSHRTDDWAAGRFCANRSVPTIGVIAVALFLFVVYALQVFR